ncbi:Intermediate filament tail domain-containing protein [Mactra antiquata]
MSTNTGKAKAKLKHLMRLKKKTLKSLKQESETNGPTVTAETNVDSNVKSQEVTNTTDTDSVKVASQEASSSSKTKDLNKSDKQLNTRNSGSLNTVVKIPEKAKKKLKKWSALKEQRKFSNNKELEEQSLRSPSRLGYSEDIPVIVENWENTSQDSNREDFNFLDLKDITTEQEPETNRDTGSVRYRVETGDIQTVDIAQQTDFPLTPSTTGLPSTERRETYRKQFVSSHKYLDEKGNSPKHPYEKTVFYVKSSPNGPLTQTSLNIKESSRNIRPKSGDVRFDRDTKSASTRIDSGYGSNQETIRISPSKSSVSYQDQQLSNPGSASSSPERNASVVAKDKNIHLATSNTYKSDNQVNTKAENMSYYTTDIISPISSARKQEKHDLQQLNDRFTTYIQKVRLLSEQNNRLDTSTFVKQTRILEEEVANLKTLYERELDVIRQELNASNREKSNYQLQCEKNKSAAIDFETRLAAEVDKNHRLIDDLNQLQRKTNTLEGELMNLRQAGDGRSDFMHLQREMDKIIRENEEHKRRAEQESLLRTEADDRCHSLTKKLEFNEQVHAQQLAEIKERLEQSQCTVISLESRLGQMAKNDVAIPDILKQVREQAQFEFKRYQMESEENYNRNLSALKCQMDNDASTIERLSSDKSKLQGQIGELNAKIRNLEGQIMTLEHQRSTVEDLIKQERAKSSAQIQEMDKKLHEMQELVFSKMREANTERDLHIPLKAEIEAMKILLEEEEKRLQLPLSPSSQQQPLTYSTNVPLTLPDVSLSSTQQQQQQQPDYIVTTATQPITTTESTFQCSTFLDGGEPSLQPEPTYTRCTLPSVSEQEPLDYVGTSTKYTYETSPSINRLQIDSPPRASPRAIGPITRAKSAPVRPGSSVQVVPTQLGQGKDYFDEMFRDLTRETLYTQTRPKSSPTERPPSAKCKEQPCNVDRPSSRNDNPRGEFLENLVQFQNDEVIKTSDRSESYTTQDRQEMTSEPIQYNRTDRPTSSVFHDYTTSTSSAVGDIKILEVNQDGKFIRLFNEGKQEVEFGGFMIQQNVGGHPVAVFRFPPRTKFAAESTITVWSGSQDPIEHQPPKDFVWKEQQKWGTGPECTTILCKPNGQAIAWMTAAHRFTKNPYEELSASGSPIEQPVPDTGNPVTTQDAVLTEMNVNLNEPKPEPVYLRREKQTPPSLSAQKHPHGSSPSQGIHPHTGQPRPFAYGNDNSSVNRQSRVQSTRPDPVPGQPYAGGSATRIGSAPLRKYKGSTGSGNIRGSGAIANKSAGVIRHGPPSPFLSPKQQEYSEFRDSKPFKAGETSDPPNPFQAPHRRFETGLQQIQSQHHVSFNPPMPRPPLFSTW